MGLLKEIYERAKRAKEVYLADYKYEIPDPTPMEPPVGYTPTPPLEELVRRMIVTHLERVAEDAEVDTPEEADDFDVGDDYEPESPYEIQDDLGPPLDKKPLSVDELRAGIASLQSEVDRLSKTGTGDGGKEGAVASPPPDKASSSPASAAPGGS